MSGRQTIRHKLPYLIANPALRTAHISNEWCQSKEYFKVGFRIHQLYREAGLPYEIPCAACHPIIEGLNNVYFLYPERDFHMEITKLPISARRIDDSTKPRGDLEQNPRVTNAQDFWRVNDLHFGEYSRWNGEHAISEEDREILGHPNGQLAIYSKASSSGIGITTMCGMELNEEILSSNVFVNGDVILTSENSDKPFTYENYETLELKVQSVADKTLNLELFVSWDEWGCCSACCCLPAVCGHEFQTASGWNVRKNLHAHEGMPPKYQKSNDNVFSSRSRVGHLSIRKLTNGPVNFAQLPPSFLHLSELLSIPPYTTRGIAVFSTLAGNSTSLSLSTLLSQFATANSVHNYQFSSGIFVDSESCKSHPQKADCAQWARCHGVSLADVKKDEDEFSIDTCHQVQFVDILVGISPLKVRVGEHQHLRIRIDPEVHNMNETKGLWRVNLRKPKNYNKNRPCILQGTVLRNDELLILDFSRFDLKIDVILNEKTKVRITFVNSRKAVNSTKVRITIFYWAIAIIDTNELIASKCFRSSKTHLDKRFIVMRSVENTRVNVIDEFQLFNG
uniref:Uncharacterized protein n=1 Tax=Caenorhabditis japonica TaxID=281687 RepID=A0A8R1HQZ6_CAEJA